MFRLYKINIKKLAYLLILIPLLATSCAPTISVPASAVSTPVPAKSQRVLKLWTHEYPSFNDGLREKWIPEFEAAHPGVKVEYTTIPYSGSIISFDSKLLAEVSSGSGPDVWAMASHNFTQTSYLEAGLLEPLDPKIFGYDSVEDLVNDYPENGLNVFIFNGKIYGLLNELTTLCLFYNKTMFDKAGIPYLPEDKPVSWDTIGTISQKMLEKDETTSEPVKMGYQFGFFANYPSAEWYIQDFYPIMRQYGQDDIYIDGKPAGNTEPVIKTLQVFHDFTYKYNAYDPNFVKDWFADFANNNVAMVTAGPWYPSVIKTINPDIKFGVAPHPVLDPENPKTYKDTVYSFGWVVNAARDSEQKILAQEFLAFILGKKDQKEQPLWWLKNVGVLQPRNVFVNSQEFQDTLKQDPWMNCFVDTFTTYDVNYYQHSADEPGSALVRAMNRVIYNNMSAKDSAELFQNELLLLP